MLIRRPNDISASHITPPGAYLNRRNFIRAGIAFAGTIATGGAYRALNTPRQARPQVQTSDYLSAVQLRPTNAPGMASAFAADEPLTAYQDIAGYNNFYEFSTDKQSVAAAAEGFVSRPWSVQIGGLCAKPATFDLDQILKFAPAEERVYRFRCVESWSMVIPWIGYSLSKLLDRVEPLGSAKYVAFETLFDPRRFPNQNSGVLDWPYVEGLRIDEAAHPLTMLVSGLYGSPLPPQDGAPLRLVVPWKYGFKSIKSIVRVTLTDQQPPTAWGNYAPREYGFYANVNPLVDHPRWSQATEQRIGGVSRQSTLLFNGYADQVASLYAGMNLTENF